MSITVLFKIQY